jgi:hypothetical protein
MRNTDETDDDTGSDPDEEFPTGDGTADSDAMVYCPHCGEAIEITLDAGSGSRQQYVEDCEVCCRPWQVTVRYGADGHADVEVIGLGD